MIPYYSCRIYRHIMADDLTEESIHETADSSHCSEEDLGQLFEAGVLHDLMWDTVDPQ